MDLFIELLKLGSVGIVAGYFSAYLSNKSHRDNRYWELRVKAYQSLIEALSDMKHYYDEEFNNSLLPRKDEKGIELEKINSENSHKVRKAYDNGVFLFSGTVNKALSEFFKITKSKEIPKTYSNFLEKHLEATEKCLKAVVQSAKKDLKVRSLWF